MNLAMKAAIDGSVTMNNFGQPEEIALCDERCEQCIYSKLWTHDGPKIYCDYYEMNGWIRRACPAGAECTKFVVNGYDVATGSGKAPVLFEKRCKQCGIIMKVPRSRVFCPECIKERVRASSKKLKREKWSAINAIELKKDKICRDCGKIFHSQHTRRVRCEECLAHSRGGKE